MSNDDKSIRIVTFSGGDSWTAEDLAAFVSHIYVLYNRTVVLRERSARTASGLIAQLAGSKSRVTKPEKLQIDSISINSPIKIDLRGIGEPIAELRELIKDLLYRNKLERQGLEEDLRHKRALNRRREQMADLELLKQALDLGNSLNATDDEKEIIVKEILGPANDVAVLCEQKGLDIS